MLAFPYKNWRKHEISWWSFSGNSFTIFFTLFNNQTLFANSFVPTSIIRSSGFFNNWSRFSTIALLVPPGKFSTILNTCWLFFLICHSTWSPQWLQPSYCFFDLMACFYLHSQYVCCLLFVFQFYCGYYWVLGNPSLLFLRVQFQNFYFFCSKENL